MPLVLVAGLLAASCGSSSGEESSNPTSDETSGENVTPSAIVPVGSDEPRATPVASTSEVGSLVETDRAVASALYNALAEEADGNVFFSPYSIILAFSMVEAGANANTEDQLRTALGITGDDDEWHASRNTLDQTLTAPVEIPDGAEPLTLRINNSPFAQAGFTFEQDYLDLLATDYGAGLQTVDYVSDPDGARVAINKQVADETEDRITELLPEGSINSDVRLTLVNTIFFEGNWVTEFNPALTEPGSFTTSGGVVVEPDMMHTNVRTTFGTGSGWSAVKLPYWGGYTMNVIVPDVDRFDEIEAMIGSGLLDEVRAIESDNAVALTMPKFSFGSDADLAPVLSSLGVDDLFDPIAADLSGMTAQARLFASGAFHQATIEIDENGTVAAAATAVVIGITSAPVPAELVVDRPFIVAIEHDLTGEILFLGRVLDPTAS